MCEPHEIEIGVLVLQNSIAERPLTIDNQLLSNQVLSEQVLSALDIVVAGETEQVTPARRTSHTMSRIRPRNSHLCMYASRHSPRSPFHHLRWLE